MFHTIVQTFNFFIIFYVIVMQIQVLIVAMMSYRALASDRFVTRHGRIQDMITSDTTPPISIVIPAYNEAAGIADTVRSMAMLHYPNMEIIVVNDGSKDETVQRMIEAFDMAPIDFPFRNAIPTQKIRRLYKSRLPHPVVLVDKESGGKSDAINAGINVSKYPYFMATDADMVLESEALIHAARHFVEDRERTVAVGGNVRPLNGCEVRLGKVTKVSLPRTAIEMAQVVEYIRSFLSARPGWSRMGSLLIVSGAFGIFSKAAVTEVGGFRNDHLGEDMEMTMRLHRHFRRKKQDYRIVYSADAVAWTEVPVTWDVLRKQRVRWHRGLIQVIWQYKGMIFNPRHGFVGMVAWPSFIAFEFIAPVLEFTGWILIPISLFTGFLDPGVAVPLILIAILLGTANSMASLFLDDRFGYYSDGRSTLRLLTYTLGEHLGFRQRSVWWRVRALFWNPKKKVWGDMQRTGVGNLGAKAGPQPGTLTNVPPAASVPGPPGES